MESVVDVIGSDAETLQKMLELGAIQSPMFDHPSGDKIVVLPKNFSHVVLSDPDMEPKVIRRSPMLLETSSFIDYVNEFKLPDQTRIFFDPEALRAVAVLDYDGAGKADRGVHRATLQLAHSPEWETWNAAAAQTARMGFTQVDFAEFLEEHGINILEPTAAELMELVTKMQITRTVNYKKSFNLHDGRQQFTYTNDGESGSVEFPARLTIAIPVFKGGELYRIEIIIRYRLQDGGSLRFALIVHRKDAFVRAALMGNGTDIKGDIPTIAEKCGVPVHIGKIG